MEKAKTNPILQRLAALWADKRSYPTRLLYAGAAIFAAGFIFIFFGPFEMVAYSGASLSYTYKDIAPVLLLVVFGVFAVATPLLALLRGKIYNICVSLISSLTLAGYIQAAFFNTLLGSLTGDAVNWKDHALEMFINLAVWVLVITAGFFVLYLSRKLWKNVVLFVSIALVFMTAAASVSIALTGSANSGEIKTSILTTDGMYEYSSEDNTFVIVLDRLDYMYIEEVLREDPNFFKKLDGFTQYTNAVSTFGRTSPAINNMLTGRHELAYTVPADQYLKDSWKDGSKEILATLTEQGYSIDLYTYYKYLFSDIDYASQYISNLQSNTFGVAPLPLLKKMLHLSTYRYAPTALKPFFEEDSNYFNEGVLNAVSAYTFKDSAYAPGFLSATANDESKKFKLYHFNGPHSPFNMKADGTFSSTPTSSLEQTMGCFNILYAAFDKMKELGIYEDATIIILGDHGAPVTDNKPISKETRIGLFYKPSGSAGTELKYSSAQVSDQNIPATIVKSTGADYTVYGKALDDIGENEEITRVYYKAICPPPTSSNEYEIYKYHIKGDASNLKNWEVVDIFDVAKDGNFY